nr:MAG TPA: hypothetical protein [Caudoviricetes sp.]
MISRVWYSPQQSQRHTVPRPYIMVNILSVVG